MNKFRHHIFTFIFPLLGLIFASAGLSPTLEDLLVMSAYYLLLAGSWNILAGFTGQFSFAHVGLAAAGAYLAAAVVNGLGLPVWISYIVSPLAVGAISFWLGLVSLRVKGAQLPLITFAFAGAFGVFLSAATDITGGSMGMQIPRLIEGNSRSIFLIVAGIAIGIYFAIQNWILDGSLGLLMQSIRDDEDVAKGSGVNIFRVKVLAFMITAAIAGFAGAFYASYVGVLAPSILSMNEMGMVMAMVVVGGMGHRYGALVGVFVLRIVEHVTRGVAAEYTTLIIAAISLVVILFFREGLLRAVERLWLRVIPRGGRWTSATKQKVLPEEALVKCQSRAEF